MSAVHQVLLFGGAAGLSMPYQMTFNSGLLSTYTADGFGFDVGLLLSNLYDPDGVSTPAGENNNPAWTGAPTVGMPTPSGGYYLYGNSTSEGSQLNIVLPASMNAKYFTCWIGIGSTGTACTLQARYDNGAVRGAGGSNSIGYTLFSQLAGTNPPRLPSVGDFPVGANRITQIELVFESAIGRINIDDLTFYEA